MSPSPVSARPVRCATAPPSTSSIEAASGSLSVTGEPGEIPMRPGVQTGDMFGAMFATYAALAGLMGKVRHGEGRQIDVSLVEASIAAAVWETSEYLATGNVPQPLGHKHRLTAPYQVFQASDGLLVIGCPNDQLFFKIMKCAGSGRGREGSAVRDLWVEEGERTGAARCDRAGGCVASGG